jgi:hypothetical protein
MTVSERRHHRLEPVASRRGVVGTEYPQVRGHYIN